MDTLVPFQSQKELDSMVKNATRDLKQLQDFVQKEKNQVIKAQLEGILISSWNLARKFDGCERSVMETAKFRKECREVFLLIAAQKRGGRKLFLNTTSSPVNGLDKVHFIWWSTVRAYQGSTLKFMDNFISNLAKPIQNNLSDSAISAETSSDGSINMSDPQWIKIRLLTDVARIIRERMDDVGDLDGFGIGSADDEKNCFLLTITLIPREDMSKARGYSDVGDNNSDNANKSEVKKEIPFRGMIPKSESSRRSLGIENEAAPPLPRPKMDDPMSDNPKDVDEDGFWTTYDPVLPLSAVKTGNKGILMLNPFNLIFQPSKTKLESYTKEYNSNFICLTI